MKVTLAIAALLLGSVSASELLAQGSFNWGNFYSGVVNAPVYNFDPADPFRTLTGNGPSPSIPPGNQTYGGAPLVGTGFTLAI